MDQPSTPPQHEQAISASVTVTGATADLLRELAAIEDRTPEEMVQEWVAGRVVIPAGPFNAEEWMFDDDGPADLSSRADEYLKGFGQ